MKSNLRHKDRRNHKAWFPYSCNYCNLGIDFPLVLRTSRSSDRRFMLKLR